LLAIDMHTDTDIEHIPIVPPCLLLENDMVMRPVPWSSYMYTQIMELEKVTQKH
jgi:hypothetical protein